MLLVVAAVSAMLGVGIAFDSIYALVAVPAVLLAAVAVVWPRQILIVMLLYIPVESFILKWLPGGSGVLSLAPEIALFLAAASAFLLPKDSAGASDRQKWIMWLVGFFAVGMVSAWLADVPWIDAVYWLRTNIRYMSAAIIVGGLGDRDWWVRSAATAVGAGLLLQSFIAMLEFVGGAGVRMFFAPRSMIVAGREFVDYSVTGPAGISGTLGFYNNFGLYSVLAAVVCAGALISVTGDLALRQRCGEARVRLFTIAVWAGVLNVLLSASRQSVLVFLAAAVAVIVVVGPRRAGSKMIPVVAGVLVLTVAALLAPSLTGPLAWIPERFGQVVGGQAVTQSLQTDRLFALARVVPGVLVLSPLLGLGPGALSSLAGVGTAAGVLNLNSENVAYVQDVGWAGVMVQTGILGFALILGLWFWLAELVRALYLKGEFDRGFGALLAGSLAAWAAGMVASSPLLVRSISLVLWAVMGLCVGGYRRELDDTGEGLL